MVSLINTLSDSITNKTLTFNNNKHAFIIGGRQRIITLSKNLILKVNRLSYNDNDIYIKLFCNDDDDNKYIIDVGLNEDLHFL